MAPAKHFRVVEKRYEAQPQRLLNSRASFRGGSEPGRVCGPGRKGLMKGE